METTTARRTGPGRVARMFALTAAPLLLLATACKPSDIIDPIVDPIEDLFGLGDDEISQYCPNTYEWVNHLALEVDDIDTLNAYKERLEAAGVAVKGPKNHHFVDSIYFYDPNGIRLELTAWKKEGAFNRADFLKKEADEAHEHIAAWTEEKRARRQAAE